ncbi:MAG: hypothetical protein ACJA2X_000953 [Halocynthiibacter sp.]|jgi:hypothetical protein
MIAGKKLVFCAALIASTSMAYATPFDGLYAPAGSYDSWSCKPSEIGAELGAVGVVNGHLEGVENSCELTEPTNIRGLDAIIYDAICFAEGEQYTHRVILMRHDSGIYVIQDGYSAEWRSCP